MKVLKHVEAPTPRACTLPMPLRWCGTAIKHGFTTLGLRLVQFTNQLDVIYRSRCCLSGEVKCVKWSQCEFSWTEKIPGTFHATFKVRNTTFDSKKWYDIYIYMHKPKSTVFKPGPLACPVGYSSTQRCVGPRPMFANNSSSPRQADRAICKTSNCHESNRVNFSLIYV